MRTKLRMLTLTAAIVLGAPSWAHAQGEPAEVDPELIESLEDWGTEPNRPQRPDRATTPRNEGNRNGLGLGRNNQRDADEPTEPTVSFGVFSEAIELTTLIDYVGSALNLNIVVKGSPSGQIVLNAPVEVPKSKLISFLDAMLEQFAYTINYEADSSFWVVKPITDIKPGSDGPRPTTRIVSTPNIKPSLIIPALSASLGNSLGGGAQGGAGNMLQAIDELGIIIINAPARDIDRMTSLVDAILQIDDNQRFIRFELDHVAAPVARDRAVGLSGGQGASAGIQGRVNNQGQPQGGLAISGGSLSNLADRIAVDPQGNALIFKGTDEEIARVKRVLAVIDVPNVLEPRNYYAGSSASQIADIASTRGLGEVIKIEDDSANALGQANFRARNAQNFQQFGDSDTGAGGPVMVVDTTRGNIIYYGTPAQHNQLDALMDELGTEDERVVIRDVTLNHTDAEVIADLMTAIITGEQQTGDSDFLPGSSGPRTTNTANQALRNAFANAAAGPDVNAAFDPEIVSVIADPDNNQVLVKAPIKQQDELARLIGRLDRRTPQVYIEALIVSVEDSENFRLAIESQLSAGQFQSQTNFGLSSAGTTFGDQRTVATGLAGLTQAVVLSNQIPVILNAAQTDTDIRILSTPQLLVNDNQESEIVSIREEPFTEISRDSGNSDIVSFGGFAEAGTTLRVTPSISDGGFLRLEYYVELSNFTSASGTDGSPPPRQTNTLTGNATVPSDSTIILGGITINNIRDTVVKVPLIGDIPLVGLLFRDTSKISTDSKLYVFLTPRIMTDPNFIDLKLLSDGPYADIDLDPTVPDLTPAMIGSTNDEAPRQALPEAPRRNSAPSSSNSPALRPETIDPAGSEDDNTTTSASAER